MIMTKMTLIIQLTLLRHHRNIIILHRRTFSTLEYGRRQKNKLRYTGTHNVNLTAEKKRSTLQSQTYKTM